MPDSWSYNFTGAESHQDAVTKLGIATDHTPESQEQVDKAMTVLESLFDSAVLGHGPYNGAISGQSTEGHTGVKTVGANDMITVSIATERIDPSVPVNENGEVLSEDEMRIRHLEAEIAALREARGAPPA